MNNQSINPHQWRKAQKQKAKLRIGLAGTSGSGKTYSALLIASGLTSWDKIGVIDTENGSADLYENLGSYKVLPIEAPFTPEKYIDALKSAESIGLEVVIIDSVTHVWKGEGGLLEFNNKLGGKFQDWAKTTPRYQAFLQGILQSKLHVITTVRKKTAYAMIQENGKSKVEKQGLEDEIRDGFEYELTLSFSLNQNHLAETSKDRTGLFTNSPEFVITAKTGQRLQEWAEQGVTEVMCEEEHLNTINDLLKAKGKTSDPILKHYNVKKLTDLTLRQAIATIASLEKHPDIDPISDQVANDAMEALK